ncbi:MAG: hypothetical protein ACN4GG_02235 [Akkermansiaceae bacterium]
MRQNWSGALKKIEMIEKVIKTAPHLEDAWWSLLISLSEMKKHSKIADTLRAYHQQFGIRLTADDINQDIFGAFINSPEGKAYFNSEE